MNQQPSIVLHTLSGATVELLAQRTLGANYSATVKINNSIVACAYAYTRHDVDQNLMILEHTHIPLTDESAERATAFFAETASYVAGKLA
jgi:hypothetical protein